MTDSETLREVTITVTTYTLSNLYKHPDIVALQEQRKRDILTMRMSGINPKAIAEIYGISFQRVYKITDGIGQ